MLALVNTNMMIPPIGPIGLDYIGGAAERAGIDVDMVDLCLSDDAVGTLASYFANNNPELVGLSFRNVDDCFWPSAEWFVPRLAETVNTIRVLTDSPIVIGGVGFSIFAEQIVEQTGADFGIRGDGEQAVISLVGELRGRREFGRVEGLIWRDNGVVRGNRPAWPSRLSLPVGLETKRGCNRLCVYCADPLAKGAKVRVREPSEVADEAEALPAKGIDVLHLCDCEFNIPRSHAAAVCEEFSRRGLGDRLRWYAYLAVVPFDGELAEAMRRAGCVGIDFTGDAGSPSMLRTYRQAHGKEDLASAVRLCRDNGIMVMIDLLLGGPGETRETVAETIGFIKQINPDCAGAPLGVRIYPGTEMARMVTSEGPPEKNRNIRRKYSGPVDFLKPTFYISGSLGERPAELVRDLIGGDERFFEPMEETAGTCDSSVSTDHNYNENIALVEAIKAGARGAYWDILRKLGPR